MNQAGRLLTPSLTVSLVGLPVPTFHFVAGHGNLAPGAPRSQGLRAIAAVVCKDHQLVVAQPQLVMAVALWMLWPSEVHQVGRLFWVFPLLAELVLALALLVLMAEYNEHQQHQLDPSQGLCPLEPARGCRPLDPATRGAAPGPL
uniref:Uncharacterized protein n=1 Tax=Tanacetum cinerariifolium TaxID=118510 RepID=A0A6L2J0X9_TANCI|nr:hypothetical protein [Tanacetum cinerariifolium]